MKKMLFTAAMTAILFASCAKEENVFVENNNPEMVPFEVVLENELAANLDNKVWLDASNLSLKWEDNDEFSVFDGVVTADGGSKFTVQNGGSNTCKLTGEISKDATGPIYFHYPYQKYIAKRGKTDYTTNISNGIIFPVDAPYKYESKPDYLPKKSLMLSGKMSSPQSTDPVVMKTPMGFVKFTLKNDDLHYITKIELTCQLSAFIAGTVAVDCNGDDPAIIMQGSGEGDFAGDPSLTNSQQLVAYDIVITPKNADHFPDGTYYFALPPRVYEKGIRLKFTDDLNWVAQKGGGSDLVINRAKVKDLGIVNSEELEWRESIDLRFLDAILKATWPFNEPQASSLAKNSTNVYTYGPDNEEFVFQHGNYDGGLYSKTGFNIRGASKAAYIQIPARTGKRIVNVALRVGGQWDGVSGTSSSNCGNPFFATAEPEQDGKLNILKLDKTFEWLTIGNTTDNNKMDAWWGGKKYGYQKQWSGFDADGEKSYRIYVSASGDFLKVINLLVQYEDL